MVDPLSDKTVAVGIILRSSLSYSLVAGLVALSMAGCRFDSSGLEDKDECFTRDDCAVGELCVDGRCVSNVGCVYNSDCEDTQICVNAQCVDAFDQTLDPRDIPDTGTDLDVGSDAVVDMGQDLTDTADMISDPDLPTDIPVDIPVDPPVDLADADMQDIVQDPPTDVVDLDADAPTDVTDLVEEDLADVPLDVVDVDLVDVPLDTVDDDMGIVLNVATYDDLPATAEEGMLAHVEDLGEDFRYSVDAGRWLFDWFYDMNPTVVASIGGDVLPSEESPAWQEITAVGGSVFLSEGAVVFDASSADADRAYAQFVHGQASMSHWFIAELSVANSRGTGFLRHGADIRNAEIAAVCNLQNGENGIRIVGSDDQELGTVYGVETAEVPRTVEVYVLADDRVDLYVDHVLLQTVPYADLPASSKNWYDVGVQRNEGGGTVTVSGAVFGTFTP